MSNYDWTEDRHECIQYMLANSTIEWYELNKMPTQMLVDMVKYDLDPTNYEEMNS